LYLFVVVVTVLVVVVFVVVVIVFVVVVIVFVLVVIVFVVVVIVFVCSCNCITLSLSFTRRYTPKDRSVHNYRCENLISYSDWYCLKAMTVL
jgi:hypothetical protein